MTERPISAVIEHWPTDDEWNEVVAVLTTVAAARAARSEPHPGQPTLKAAIRKLCRLRECSITGGYDNP